LFSSTYVIRKGGVFCKKYPLTTFFRNVSPFKSSALEKWEKSGTSRLGVLGAFGCWGCR